MSVPSVRVAAPPRPAASARQLDLAGAHPEAGAGPPRSRLSAALALRAAAICVLAMAVTWALAAFVPTVHWRDAVALNDFTQLDTPRVDPLANDLLRLLDPLLYTLWAALLVAIALLRRRPRVALAVTILAPAAPLTAELLKPLLAHPHAHAGFEWIGAASWPSGHSTAAMTLVLCALLVAPHRLRPTVAVLGSAFAIAVGLSLLILAWHMPSDVLGGYLLAALYGSLALAALRAAERRQPRSETRWRSEDLLAPVVVVLAGTLAVVVVVLIRAGQVASFASGHHLLIAAAAVIAALAALISSALALALRS
ncbi:MAG TPA: phosphatase PAP2 family protein [Solirubrobacteraceae bacterium]